MAFAMQLAALCMALLTSADALTCVKTGTMDAFTADCSAAASSDVCYTDVNGTIGGCMPTKWVSAVSLTESGCLQESGKGVTACWCITDKCNTKEWVANYSKTSLGSQTGYTCSSPPCDDPTNESHWPGSVCNDSFDHVCDLDNVLAKELTADGGFFADKIVKQFLATAFPFLTGAVCLGGFGGFIIWISNYFSKKDGGCMKDHWCSQWYARWYCKHPKAIILTVILVLICLAYGLGYWIKEEAFTSIKTMNGQLANKAIYELGEEFIRQIAQQIDEVDRQGLLEWNLPMTNPMAKKIGFSSFSGTLTVASVYGGKFNLVDKLTLPGFATGELHLVVDLALSSLMVAALVGLIVQQTSGTLFIGIDLNTKLRIGDRAYTFTGLCYLPFAMNSLPNRTTLMKNAEGALFFDNGRPVKTALLRGLQLLHSSGGTIVDETSVALTGGLMSYVAVVLGIGLCLLFMAFCLVSNTVLTILMGHRSKLDYSSSEIWDKQFYAGYGQRSGQQDAQPQVMLPPWVLQQTSPAATSYGQGMGYAASQAGCNSQPGMQQWHPMQQCAARYGAQPTEFQNSPMYGAQPMPSQAGNWPAAYGTGSQSMPAAGMQPSYQQPSYQQPVGMRW